MKYKLIKEYPGSTNKDFILDERGKINFPLNHYLINGIRFNPENYPEFWELVVEKDYEILSFYNEDNNFCKVNKTNYMEKFVLANLNIFKIHSVKRLSDGEIFTIGDKCSPIGKYRDNIHPITKIWFCNPGYLRLSSNNYTLGIKDIQKVKIPLFTTEDGVDIFKNIDKYYTPIYIVDKALNIKYCEKDFSVKPSENVKYFFNKEKAEEYILLNKPCLSINDIKNIFPRIFDGEKELKKLVKSKIQQSV